jgi:hypothetical protein
MPLGPNPSLLQSVLSFFYGTCRTIIEACSLRLLSFITPAVVSPETVDVELPKDGTAHVMRRGLMLIAKILQNLVNNLYFGKEPHMASLNEFLSQNASVVSRYLAEVNVR